MTAGSAAPSRGQLLWVSAAFCLAPLALLPLGPHAAVWCFVFLCLAPALSLLRGSTRTHQGVAMALVGLTYLLSYPVAFLSHDAESLGSLRGLSMDSIETALVWSFRGVLCMLLAYVLVSETGLLRRARPARRGPIEDSGALSMSIALGLISAIALVVSIVANRGVPFRFLNRSDVGFQESSLQMLVHYPEKLGLVFLFLYMTLRLRGVRNLFLDWVFAATFAGYLVLAAGSGSKGIFLSILLCLGLPFLLRPLRWSPRQIVGVSIALVGTYVTFSVVSDYRTLVRLQPPSNEANVSETIEYQALKFSQAFGLTLSGLTSSPEPTLARTSPNVSAQVIARSGSSLRSFASLLQLTEEVSPTENPVASLLAPAYAFVPRSLYAGKPHYFDSGDHARFYHWQHGGISVSLVGSLYWAWGLAGVCFGMAFVGLLLALVSRGAETASRSWPVFSGVWILLILSLADTGVTIQSTLTDLVRLGLVLWVLERVAPLILRVHAQTASPELRAHAANVGTVR